MMGCHDDDGGDGGDRYDDDDDNNDEPVVVHYAWVSVRVEEQLELGWDLALRPAVQHAPERQVYKGDDDDDDDVDK